MAFDDVSDNSLATDRKASQAALYLAGRDDTTSVAESMQWNLLAQQDPEIMHSLVSGIDQSKMSVIDSEVALHSARSGRNI